MITGRNIVDLVGIAVKVGSDTVSTGIKVGSDIAGTVIKVGSDTVSTGIKIGSDIASTITKVGSDIASTVAKARSDTVSTVAQIGSGSSIVSIGSKVGSDIASTITKVRSDTVSTGIKVGCDIPSTVTKVRSDIASTLAKVRSDTCSTGIKVRSDAVSAVNKVGSDTVSTGMKAGILLVRNGDADEILKIAGDVFLAGSDAVVTDLAFQVIRHTLEAMTYNLEGAAIIWEGIFTNDINADKLSYIRQHKLDLAKFFLDLVEPAKLFVTTDSTYGRPSEDNVHGEANPYNELNLTSAKNRNAVIYQLQRLAKSLVVILAINKDRDPWIKPEDVEMNISLKSDFRNGTALPATFYAKLERSEGNELKERWLFVNGIAGEYDWLKLSCDKLKNRFQREIAGIFNRSDGILWDLIECAGERSLANRKTLVQRTRSSMEAQSRLRYELETALWPSASEGETPSEYVVMIAHSQGCLLLRQVLQDLLHAYPREHERRKDMKSRLRVFTFGNPSMDWKAKDGSDKKPLHEYVDHTEHFANAKDFVAQLGILRPGKSSAESGYEPECTFVNSDADGKGHLFGAQYSLRWEDYGNGENSKLLNCAEEEPLTWEEPMS